MTWLTALTLFASMVVLALLPGPGILVVVARTLSTGFKHGVATSIGIVAGDYVFIILSIYGLSTLSQVMGELFVVVRYAGSAYLIWLGLSLLRIAPANVGVGRSESAVHDSVEERTRYPVDFAAGLITTVSNPKAILFYVSFFPAFLDLSRVALADLVLILIITLLAVGGTMVFYAFVAVKAKYLLADKTKSNWLNRVSCCLLVGCGVLLFYQSF